MSQEMPTPTPLVMPRVDAAAPEARPTVAGTEVLVEVLAYDGGAAAQPVARGACGIVVATGELAREWQGKAVLVPAHFPCGDCETCRRGGVFVCATQASLAAQAPKLPRFIAVPSRWLTPLPEGTPPTPALARLGGDALLAYTMYAYGNVGPRDLCLVLGATPTASWLVGILVSKGAHVATFHDGEAPPREAVRHVSCPRPPCDATPALRQALDAAATAAEALRHPWRCFVTDPAYLGLATALVNPFATITCVADAKAAPSLSLEAAMRACVTMTFVADGHPDLLPDLLGLALADALIAQTAQ